MNRSRLALAIPALLLAGAAAARPVDQSVETRRPLLLNRVQEAAGSGTVAGLSYWGLVDTATYGGTYWATDSLRWEALRDSVWTFEGGQGSYLNDGSNINKPVGYHQMFDGWYGIDLTLDTLACFRRNQTCAILGSWSLWCGLAESEANVLCYVAGQGYGNAWSQTIVKQFTYPGAGSVLLSYDIRVEAEPGYDYTYVLLDSTGTAVNPGPGDILLASYTGNTSRHETISIPPGDLPHPGHIIFLKVHCTSDGAYSDEDGLYPTSCGHTVIDNITLGGAINDVASFESGLDGWYQVLPTTGVGDYTDIVDMATILPPRVTFCPCSMSDSVLVFFDPNDEHPLDQHNLAVSPWIDLERGGDVGRPGKILLYNTYAELPLANYIFADFRIRYYPEVCPATGLVIRTPWRDQNTLLYYGEAPFCTPPGEFTAFDCSALVMPAAEQVQVAFGVVNLCRTAPFGVPCTGVSNTTPWLDNIALGVYGQASTALIFIQALDHLQDDFAQDGSLNPASTGRFDTNRLKNRPTPGPGTIRGDTLVVAGDGGNTEVRVVFRVHPGAFTNSTSLDVWAAKWTPEAAPTPAPSPKWHGGTWYTARLDTAEQGGMPVPGKWMGCFHESDPGFSGTDRTPDPVDPSQNANEIFPDHILTPGGRIDYFLKARYIPPDPRNPSGTAWYLLADTTGGRFFEQELLPSSTSTDTSWNCTLYVDHHDDRGLEDQEIEEAGLKAALGSGGNNAEGTKYDRFDDRAPTAGQMSFGRPIQTSYGASVVQAFAYRQIAWHCYNLGYNQVTAEDANVLTAWLLSVPIYGNRWWGSGDNLAWGMATSGQPSTVHFLVDILGTMVVCPTIRSASCPDNSALDSTYCLQLVRDTGSWLPEHRTTTSARGNSCPEMNSFDVIYPSSSEAKGDLEYVKASETSPVKFESVAKWNPLPAEYKTVLDAVGVGRMRTTDPGGNTEPFCRDPLAGITRAVDVLDWFNLTPGAACRIPAGIAGTPGAGLPPPPRFRTALGSAWPNPMTATTRIQFVTAAEQDRVTLRIFDVTGRLVRTLVNGPLPAGPHDAVWDGADGAGRPVSSGLYFYNLIAAGFQASKKLVLLK